MTPITQVKYTRALICCLSIVNLFHREVLVRYYIFMPPRVLILYDYFKCAVYFGNVRM